MSDTSQGPGWWLASDGKWYPPELWTGPRPAGPIPAQGSTGAYPGQSRPETSSGAPAAAQAPPGYGQYAPYGGPNVRPNNGLAIASWVCACAGFLFLLPAVIGVILGFVARSQIRQSGGGQGGDGLAVAGIIVGLAWIGLFVILFIVSAATTNNTSGVVGPVTVFALSGA